MNQELHNLVHEQFTLLGKFIMVADDKHEWRPWRIDVDNQLPRYPATYAFSLDNEIVYVGSATRGIRYRFRHYCRGSHQVRHRLFSRIYDVVISGRQLNVLCTPMKDGNWNGLPVCGVVGLEYGLIRALQPVWNQVNKRNDAEYQRIVEIDMKRGAWQ